MAEKPKRASTTKTTISTATASKAKKASATFSDAEKTAMKERAAELKKQAKGAGKGTAAGEADVLAKIAELAPADRAIAERIHALAKEHAPSLTPKTWYGMPGYARDGKVAVFFQGAAKFGTRYATLGFQDGAALDDGDMWPTAYAITKLTPAVERKIGELLRRAVR